MLWKAGIILDLDDTLYLEEEYVGSGFRAIGKALASDEAQAKAYGDWLIDKAASQRDGRTFNHFLAAFPDLQNTVDVAGLVKLYREHSPDLVLDENWRKALLDWREQGIFLGLISDGALIGQQRKVEALGLGSYFDHIILTDQYGKDYWKPHKKAFQEMQEVSGLKASQLVYIGDNVLKDFIAPNELGWHTLRLRLSGQIRAGLEPETEGHAAHYEAESHKDMLTLIARQLFALE